MNDALKPCPFCGGSDLEPFANTVACDGCGARGPTQDVIELLADADRARKEWNTRQADAEVAQLWAFIEHLKADSLIGREVAVFVEDAFGQEEDEG